MIDFSLKMEDCTYHGGADKGTLEAWHEVDGLQILLERGVGIAHL
jgi:hypothetical protein